MAADGHRRADAQWFVMCRSGIQGDGQVDRCQDRGRVGGEQAGRNQHLVSGVVRGGVGRDAERGPGIRRTLEEGLPARGEVVQRRTRGGADRPGRLADIGHHQIHLQPLRRRTRAPEHPAGEMHSRSAGQPHLRRRQILPGDLLPLRGGVGHLPDPHRREHHQPDDQQDGQHRENDRQTPETTLRPGRIRRRKSRRVRRQRNSERTTRRHRISRPRSVGHGPSSRVGHPSRRPGQSYDGAPTGTRKFPCRNSIERPRRRGSKLSVAAAENSRPTAAIPAVHSRTTDRGGDSGRRRPEDGDPEPAPRSKGCQQCAVPRVPDRNGRSPCARSRVRVRHRPPRRPLPPMPRRTAIRRRPRPARSPRGSGRR